jgi:predicted nucleic acid-binding protein
MKSYADTGFLVSLYINETTTTAANIAVQVVRHPLPLIPLAYLELRNALLLAAFRKQISEATRQAAWRRVELDIRNGIYLEATVSQLDLHEKAAQLAEKYTGSLGTRTLDLLHLAAANLLGARQLLSFDERQRQAAKREGLKVLPAPE